MDCGHISLWPRLPSEGRLVSEALSPEHREIVTFVQRGWSCVKTELEQGEHICQERGELEGGRNWVQHNFEVSDST